MDLNGKNVFYPRVAEIVWKHIENDENNIHSVRNELIECNKIFQFAYSKPTLKPTVLLKDEVLISEMNFIWNSGSGKAKTINESLKSDSSYHQLELFKRTGNWKGSWRGKKISRWAKRKRAERKKIKQKKEGWLQSKINNLNVSQKLKKKKQTKKSCEVGFKT